MRAVIETALDNNRDLQEAALNIEAARAQYGITRFELYPRLQGRTDATLQHQSDDLTITGFDDNTQTYEAAVSLPAYEIDLFGRLRSLKRSALEDYLATAEAQQAAKIALIGETARSYLVWLESAAALGVIENTLDAQLRSYEIIRQSFEKGVVSRLDLARAATAVENARRNLAIYKRRQLQAENALTLLMGGAQINDFLPDDPPALTDVEFENILPAGLPSDVLLMRPDIRRAEHELLAANADIGAARAAFFPSISLSGSYGFASENLDNLFSSAAFGAWSFMPQITIPLFPPGRLNNNLDLAEVRKEIEVVQYERAIQTAFREVADALAGYETLDEQIIAQRALVDATSDAYRISNARYDVGIDNYLSVLDAQRENFAAELELVALYQDVLANHVTLYQALGGGQL